MSDNFDKLMNSKISASTEKKAAPPPPKPKRSKAKRALLWIVIVLCLLVLLVCGTAVWGYTVSVDEHILPNVYVGNVAVGGMTREEADKALRDAGFDALAGQSLAVRLPAGAKFAVDYLRSGAVMGRNEAVDTAYALGHGSNVFSNLWGWAESRLVPVHIEPDTQNLDEQYIRACMDEGILSLDGKLNQTAWVADVPTERLLIFKGAGGVELDTDELYRAVEGALRAGQTELRFDTLKKEPAMPNLEDIYSQIAVEPVNAWYSETFEVMPEVVGVSFDLEQAAQIWQAAAIGEQAVVPLIITQPQYTAEQLRSLLFRDLLGAQITFYYGSTAERINNIRLAASKLDGLVLLPGQTFSYNDVVGQRTVEAGFQVAKAYSDGQEVDELGGGICQVSSTLYGATLYARLKIVSRQNHYFKVGYLDYGLDATVSWRQPDFKFRNDKDFPIKLAAYLNEDDQSLVVEVWGTDMDGIKVRLYSQVEPIYDSEYWDVQIGNSVKTFGDLYDANGDYLDTTYINSGIYYFHDEDIEWPDGVEKHLSDAFAPQEKTDPYAF